MADDGAFDLGKFSPHQIVPPEKGQRRGIMTEEQHPLVGPQRA